MKAAAFAVAVLLAGSADELATTEVGALRLKAPAAWQRTENEGTTRFAAPSGEAYFEIDVGQVQRQGGMPAAECLGKILDALGGPQGFKKVTIGGQPAAMKESADKDEAGKTFLTQEWVGCSGRTTWSLQFHMVDAKKDRFAKVAESVGKSVEYKGK